MRPQCGDWSKLRPDQEQSCCLGKCMSPVPLPRFHSFRCLTPFLKIQHVNTLLQCWLMGSSGLWVPTSSHPLAANFKLNIQVSLRHWQLLRTSAWKSLRRALLPFKGEEIPLHPLKLFPLLQVYGWDLPKTAWKICGKEEKRTQSSHSPHQPLRTAASYLCDSCTLASAYLLAKHSTKLGYSKETRPCYHPPKQSSTAIAYTGFLLPLAFKFWLSTRRDSQNLNPFTFTREYNFQHNCLWNDCRVQEP